jgi:glutamyl-tRNA reductase
MKGQVQENTFYSIHLSHKDTPVEIREMFTFDEEQTKEYLFHLRDLFGIQEAILLSTCNRTELYYYHTTLPEQELLDLVAYLRSLR